MSQLKRVEPGWLKQQIEISKAMPAEKRAWAWHVIRNWRQQ